MVRDWNLIRDVIEACEQDRLEDYISKSGADYDEDDLSPQELDKLALENAKKYRKLVLGHLELCIDAGFICNDARLTMKGHDFLIRLRDANTWNKIKSFSKHTGIVLTVESIAEIAACLVKKTVNRE
ncbi:MAG: DUF2513 domain-containing protein [Succinatimonas sp.]|nr:DUF2513 domain-containing protein [Succinatimonas sp.]